MLIDLLRVRQWYKNLIIFLPLVFSGNSFEIPSVLITVFGFFCLSLASSANYVLNDILDKNKDRRNKEKKDRPIAAGKISVFFGFIIYLVLVFISASGAYMLSPYLCLCIAILLFLGAGYSTFMKDEIFLDILLISINFVIRAVAGAVLISVIISPWLVLCPFFLALFMSVGKRRSEIKLLGSSAPHHRKVLKGYTSYLTSTLMTTSTTLLIISYALYCFLSVQGSLLLISLPAMLYVVFRYTALIEDGSDIARHPERFLYDIRSVIGIIIWVGSVGLIIYL